VIPSTNYLVELSIRPDLNQQLVPQHARTTLRARGLDIDSPDFVPMKKEDMLARLD
jgi:glycogen synthase kinase 3 beta